LLRSPLVHFLLLGALLFGLNSAQSSVSEPTVVEVLRSEIDERIAAYQSQMGRIPSAVEAVSIENQIIENALWLQQARALGLHKTDSVVRQRLILNMRFLEGQIDVPEDELFRKAMDLGMDQSDTVVQRRLIDRVQAMIRAGVRSRTPDDSVLRTHYESTASRWRQPALLDLTQVYFSRDKRGDRAEIDAAALLLELTEQGIEPGAAVALADPFLSGHRLHTATPNRIVARFGPAFAAGVEHERALRWVGPVESAFGAHLVWIHERIESRIPTFDEVQQQVLEDWITEETRRALRAQIGRRRRIVEVRVIEDREPPRAAITRGEGR
jgi:hypothetical protein